MKNILFVLSIVSIVMFTSCTSNNLGEESPYGTEVNQLEGVSIELNKTTYQSAGDQFELKVVNHSEKQITYGVGYTLEYYDETTWYKVEPNEKVSFITIAYILDPGEEAVEEITLEYYYEPLKVGRYRLIRQIDGEPLVAEFEVLDN